MTSMISLSLVQSISHNSLEIIHRVVLMHKMVQGTFVMSQLPRHVDVVYHCTFIQDNYKSFDLALQYEF